MNRSSLAVSAILLANSVSALSLDQTEALASSPLESILAQATSDRSCTTSATRNKADLPDFYNILESGTEWSDPDFPTSDALCWSGVDNPNDHMDLISQNYEWKRIKDEFPDATLFGSQGITADDVIQGDLFTCWFHAALAGLAMVPERVEKLIVNDDNELNDAGIYAVNFQSLGIPHTVVVDDQIPVMTNDDGQKQTVFSKVSKDSGMWVPIVEKALAKLYGNYCHTENGYSNHAGLLLAGGFYTTYSHSLYPNNMEVVWEQIYNYDPDTQIITSVSSSICVTISEDENRKKCIHAYTIVGSYEHDDGTRLVKIRNPFGYDETDSGAFGEYLDDSDFWTDAIREQAGHTGDNDGTFYVDLETYYQNFQVTYVNDIRTDDDNVETIVKLGVDRQNYMPINHKFKLTSDSDKPQDVKLVAQGWNYRSYGETCMPSQSQALYGMLSSPVVTPWYSYDMPFAYGSFPDPELAHSLTLQPGESKDITMNITDSYNKLYVNDWSIQVSSKDAFTFESEDDLVSDSLPTIVRKDD